jgi:hypothetical protein
MQKHVTPSVNEAELAAVISMVQAMMHIYRVVSSESNSSRHFLSMTDISWDYDMALRVFFARN